jgi:protocatechuate 3,4-dioxygenase beta subunit
MNEYQETRRNFIRNAMITTAAALPLLANCERYTSADEAKPNILELIKKNAQPIGTEAMGAIEAPANVTWKTAFDIGKDDGEPMIISGTVYKPDGKTVAPYTLIYFYHTDKYGIYGRHGQPKHGRFRGWMLTDGRGRYEFSSVRPASYPNSTQSQHVHMTVTGVNHREDWVDSILFEGDRFLTQRERDWSGKRGGFNPIVMLTRGADGIQRAVRDIQLMAG